MSSLPPPKRQQADEPASAGRLATPPSTPQQPNPAGEMSAPDAHNELTPRPQHRQTPSQPAPHTEPQQQHAKANDPPAGPKNKKKRLQPGPLAVSARNKERLRRNSALALLAALLAIAAFTTIKSFVTPEPTVDEVAAQVSNVITQDGGNAMFETVGAQFLQAYLTIAATPEEQRQVDTIINTLTDGAGTQWRKPASVDPVPQQVVVTPSLTLPLAQSTTTPGAITGIYRAFTKSTNNEEPEEVIYAVTLAADENGVVRVVAPPAYLTLPNDGKVTLEEPRDIDGAISNASAAQLTEFLKVWAAAGGNNPDPALATQLKAWLAPDADRMASTGLGGKFTLAGLESVELRTPVDGSSATSGSITVRWKTLDGATFTQKYAITVSTAPGGKLQVNRIGPA